MIRAIQTLYILLLLTTSLFAQEDIYSYRFNLDTTITGAVSQAEHIFPNCETTLISFYNTLKNEETLPYIDFFDENYEQIERITFDIPNTVLRKSPLVFDFDGDSFDEVVFAIIEPDRIYYLYFDPSNTPQIKSIVYEIPIKGNKFVESKMIAAQLDEDDFFEMILLLGESYPKKNTINGMWAIDIEEKKMLWEDLSAEDLMTSKPINIVSDSLSFVICSGSAGNISNTFVFCNGNYFVKNKYLPQYSYNRNFQENKWAKVDTLVNDYSIDSVAFIRGIDAENNLLWQRNLGGKNVKVHIDSVTIDGKKRIILATYCYVRKKMGKSSIEIINPRTGTTENKTVFANFARSVFSDQQRIFVCFDREIEEGKDYYNIVELGLDLNPIMSFRDSHRQDPVETIKINEEDLLITTNGTSVLQKMFVFDNNLNIIGETNAIGKAHYLDRLKIIAVYDFRVRETKLYSIIHIPWYDRISPTLLRNVAFSFLTILLVTLLLWINTLRVASKKIKRQKKEIEETHAELKATTSKLIRSEKLAVYGTIASGIAHEINSPLGAIINSAQRIKNNPGTDLEKNITLIEKAGKRSKDIIEKLLVSTRTKSDNENTNMIDALNEWMELSQGQFENLGIKFITEINSNLLLAISSTELNQIFTNVFFNARDSISNINGGDKVITVFSAQHDNSCRIIIRDTGIGFSKEKLEIPFEAFNTTKEKGKGTGLGLWVVKSILDNINGQIKISNYENGAEVEIIIPLFEEITDEEL
ncbi:MAG: HAMP domain-containing sensor histidine kinase [Melioribacteraceae bacterium]|jgi:signal transduction histidine kinase|nr:HAMP domain-containing sensor histidine kinase [Melioribacteraceae bacterium]